LNELEQWEYFHLILEAWVPKAENELIEQVSFWKMAFVKAMKVVQFSSHHKVVYHYPDDLFDTHVHLSCKNESKKGQSFVGEIALEFQIVQ